MTPQKAAVKERPILFSAPMVRAILDGTKFQTRRVVKLPKHARFENATVSTWDERAERLRRDNHADALTIGYLLGERTTGQDLVCNMHFDIGIHVARCPYGQPGDRLWVKETWRTDDSLNRLPPRDFAKWPVEYLATGTIANNGACYGNTAGKVRPSIFMPRWASRITLELTDVRVQRVQEMTAQDAIDEGIPSRGIDRDGPNIASALMYLSDYEALWNSLNEKRGYGWDANPWVWCITFKRVESAA